MEHYVLHCYRDDPAFVPELDFVISGTYKDPDGYFVCEKDPEEFERFEATFPAKEMLLVDEVDSKAFFMKLFEAMYDELPLPKQKRKNNGAR